MAVLHINAQTLVNRNSLLVSKVNLRFLLVLMVVKMASPLLVRPSEEEDNAFVELSKSLTR